MSRRRDLSSRHAPYAGLLALAMGSACTPGPDEVDAGEVVFELRGTLNNFASGEPIAGATLCPVLIEGFDCTTTGADGSFSLPFPSSEDSYLEAEHPDYPPHLLHIRPLGGVPFEPVMLTQSQVDAALSVAGGSVDLSAGHYFGIATNGQTKLNGVQARLSTANHLDPVYFDGLQSPDPLLPATSSSGAFFVGNVEAGTFTVFADHPDRTCLIPSRSTNADGDGVRYVFEAGTVSVSDAWTCDVSAGEETGR